MGGMTCGSIVFSSFFKKFKKLKKILFVWQMAQMVFALLFVLIIVFLKTAIPAFVFFVLMAIAGFFTGWEFPLVNSIYLNEKNLFSDSISRFYSFDLAGATLGSLLTATFLVPVCGIVASGILFFIIKMIVGIFVCKLRKL
jgi:predicted membrane-bound spermidine synthase